MTSRTSRVVAATSAVAVSAALLCACDGNSAAAADGGTLTFFDPLEYSAWTATNSIWSNSQATNNLTERLLWQDPDTGELRPWLATDYRISDDHLTYTFHLRKGVTFSDGSPFNADIVRANFDQHGFGAEDRGITPDPFWAGYAGTDVLDDNTVAVHLSEPDAGFLQVLSNYRASSILARSYLDKDLNGQSVAQNIIGTGPFVVESVDGTKGITLKRRDDYNWPPTGSDHSGPAHLSRIVFKTVAEAGTRVGALRSGEAQISRNIAPYDESRVTDDGGELVPIAVQGETNDLTTVLADPEAPTQDRRVRLALQAATDRQEINAVALSPSYPVPTSALAPKTPERGDSSRFLRYDPDKANRLLDDAGWVPGADGIRTRQGQRLTFHLRVAPFYQVSQSVLEVLQSQWKKVGAEITLSTPSLTQYQSEMASGKDWDFTQGQQSTGDPNVLRTSYSSKRTYELKNPSVDPVLDNLVEGQAREFDPQRRARLVQQAEDRIFSEGYSIPLYDETQTFGLARGVHGFGTESTGRAWLYDTTV
jgi:peptide/nickel transport system substrate-binding protein